jgi:hypothetical protein
MEKKLETCKVNKISPITHLRIKKNSQWHNKSKNSLNQSIHNHFAYKSGYDFK